MLTIQLNNNTKKIDDYISGLTVDSMFPTMSDCDSNQVQWG